MPPELVLAVRCVLTPTGYQVVGITGPIADKVLAYGILEAGREAVARWHAEQAAGSMAIRRPTAEQTRALAPPG